MSYMVFTKSSIYQNIQKIRIKLLGYLGKIFFLLLRIISKNRRSFFLYLVNAFSKLGSSKPVDFDSLTNCGHLDNKLEDDQQLTMSGKSKPNVIQTLSVEEGEWIKIKSSNLVLQKMQNLVQGFQARAENVKSRLTQPPTPSPTPPPADSTDSCESPKKGRPRLESLIQQEDVTATAKDYDEGHVTLGCCKMPTKYIPKFPTVLDPQSKLYISWLFFVMLSYVYNAWGIVLRAVFPYQAPDNLPIFLTFDYLSDIIYIIDLAFFKVRLQFLQDGFWVDDPEKTRKNYFRKAMFKMDVLSLLPLDLFYFIYGTNPLFRLPRLLKTQTFWEFFHRVDAVAKTPYVIRIIRTLLYMMYLIHLNACAYYAMSTWEGIGSNKWVFNGEGNAYIRCFYFATKTATSIGKNPKPENEYEYVFMTISWLMGVFIFAFLIGQIRDIVATATQSKTQYRQLMDQTVMYMRNLNLPDDLQRRVRLWLNHTWEQQKTLNEGGILDSLPRKMKTDVAINVHYNTLVKVQLFKDCDKALLRDLVLQLKPVLFLPGDYICRKGEVGKEMYIVNKGLVQVTDGENGEIILATLSEGSVFGEISLLGISGCSRRTADVRSQGFSNLFVLSKDDLWEALKNYPEAQKVLRKKAKLLIRENEARDRATKNNNIKKVAEPVIKHDVKKPSTPQMVRTVMQVVPKDSKCALMLMGKSRKSQSHNPLPAVECVSPKSKPLRHSSIAVIMKTKSAASLAKNRRFSPQPEKKDFIVECKERSSSAGTLKFMNYTQPAYESPNDQSPRDLAKIGIPDLPSTVQRHSVGGDESTAILNTIQAFIPRDSYYKKRRNTTQPEIQQQKDSSDVPKPNSSEDSGISVDSNHSRPHALPARKSDDDLYSTEESGDSFSELSTICKQENATTNNDEQQSNEDNEQEEETIGRSWISPASSVLSLRSLFRTSSSSRSSGNKTETQYPHRDAGSDIFDLSGSVTSNSTSAGYENLAFVPVDLFSRRSSIFSDSSC